MEGSRWIEEEEPVEGNHRALTCGLRGDSDPRRWPHPHISHRRHEYVVPHAGRQVQEVIAVVHP